MFLDGSVRTISSASSPRSAGHLRAHPVATGSMLHCHAGTHRGNPPTGAVRPSVTHTAAAPCRVITCTACGRTTERTTSPAGHLPHAQPMLTSKSPTGSNARTVHTPRRRTRRTGTNGFPFSNFKHSLTLFSKFFSSFPHGTFSLSVYCQYLALDGIYHPLRAAFPSNSTLRKHTDRVGLQGTYGVITLYDPAFQPSSPWAHAGCTSILYNSLDEPRHNDFQHELLPLHSPLLRESLLVSFPPLSYMLKSSGSSCLISGPVGIV